MASKFNDEQLRLQALKLTDPYDQNGLIWAVPDGAKLLDITNVYTFERYPREKVYCVQCHGHHHKFGFTALLTSGDRVLLGSTCGERMFGQSWADAEKRIEERGDRQFELRKLDRLALMASTLEMRLVKWLPIMEQASGRRAAFDKHLGELASRVREAVLRNRGALTIFRRVQNNAARAAGMQTLSEHQEVTVGQLAGVSFFNSLDPAKAVSKAIETLAAMKQGINATDGVTTKALTKRRRDFEKALESVEIAAEIHAGAQEFFTLSNFKEMLKWANEHGATRSRYELDDQGVVRVESSLGGIKIWQVPEIDIALLDVFKDYRRAD